MEFLTPQKKKEKARRLYIGYALFGILISLATYIMISTALGYEIFSTKGEIVQNGLLFVDSRPSDAQIYINDSKESSNTNAKLSLPEDSYPITLRKDGYRDWKKTVNLMGGKVFFLTYPRLLPVAPKEVDSRSYTKEPEILQSRDKRWLALYPGSTPNDIYLQDLENPTADIVTITLPSAVLEGSTTSSCTFVEWAGDNVHFLVRLTLSSGKEKSVVINREKPLESYDLNALLGTASTSRHYFWDGKWDKIAVHEATGTVRLADIKEKSVSAGPLIVEQVKNLYILGGETAVYTVMNNDLTDVKFYKDSKTYVILSYKSNGGALTVKGAGFNRNDYLLIAGDGLEKTYIYKNLLDAIQKSSTGRAAPFVIMPLASSYGEFSRSNRFVFGTEGNEMVVYDIEQRELKKYSLDGDKPLVVGWLDDSRLYSRATNNDLSVMDYDGQNNYLLSENVVSIPYTDRNIEYSAFLVKGEALPPAFCIIDIASESK